MRTHFKNLLAIYLLTAAAPLYAQITLPAGGGYLDKPANVTSIVIKKENTQDLLQYPALLAAEKAEARSFVDGFGRPIQSIGVAASPSNKDIISIQRYDALGRPLKQYLPYEATAGTGAYTDIPQAETNQANFYTANTYGGKVAQDIKPWAAASYETSPLQRLIKQGGVGDGFQTDQHYKTISYRSSLATDNVLKWNSAGTASGTYANNELAVVEATDEANVKTITFTDRLGRLLLKKQQATATLWYSTYYGYDNANNIVYIVAPKAFAKMGTTYDINIVPELVYRFYYDNKNRLVRKKTPGAKETFMVYDPLDRLVLTQDGNLRSAAGTAWMYIKYDNAGRAIIQGKYTHGTVLTQDQMQAHVNSQACYATGSTTYYEQRMAATASGYSNQCFPVTGTEERMYFYFDDYDFNYDGAADYAQLPQGLPGEASATTYTIGLPTGSKRKILGSGTPGTWLEEISFYDKYLRPIQTRSSNQAAVGVNDHSTTVYNFIGQALQTKTVKNVPAATTVNNVYEYDVQSRLQKIKQTNGAGTQYTVALYEYNALGQTIDKKLHSTGGAYLQSVDMRYNIRGQLLSINNAARTADAGVTNDDGNDLFGLELLYDKTNAELANTADWRGMISAVKWSALPPTGPIPPQKAFLYSYDFVGRLSSAVYKDRSSGTFALRNFYNETLTYDENGNIATLQRNNLIGAASTLVDNLTYTYKNATKDNQLDNVTDAVATNTTGYGWRNYTGSTGVYTYDDNGNLLTDPKKGTTLTYNELDKTTLIQKTATKKIEYKYDAAGVRLTKIVTNGAVVKTTEYIGGFVTENSSLIYYAAAEGRVRNDAGVLKHEYMISDWQGNVRLSFEDNGSGTAITRQESSYYAFGMQIAGGYTPPTNTNKFLYNAGSELQDDIEEGMADYYSTFYREYDAVLGRFNGVDVAAAELHDWGVYHYSYNNPVNFNDPWGDYAGGGSEVGKRMQSEYESWREGRYGSYSDILSWGYLGDPFKHEFSDGGGGGGGEFSSSANMYRALKRSLANFAPPAPLGFYNSDPDNVIIFATYGKGGLRTYAEVWGWNADQGLLGSFADGFVGGAKSTWEGIKAAFTWEGIKENALNQIMPARPFMNAVKSGVQLARNLPNYTSNDYAYGAGFLTEKVLEAWALKKVTALPIAAKGTNATLYRNFGWNELSSIKNAGGKFSIHPNQFQGKQFWVGESGMDMWSNSGFAKPFTAKITVPKSFVTPGSKNYVFMESDMMIDGFPGGTVLPGSLQKFNSAMKIEWIRY